MKFEAVQLRFSLFVGVMLMMALLSAEVVYQGVALDIQRHTIRQLFGLEPGPDATPILPPYVPPVALRSI